VRLRLFKEAIVTRPTLSFSVAHYDRYIPFLDGTVGLDGFELKLIQVGQSVQGRYGRDRHERMLHDGEFDACEVSLSSYLMARARKRPFTAIPVFPRRLFSQSQIWINPASGITEPKHLIGKRVGLSTFQTTLSVLAKGDLQSEYGVPWRSIEWVVNRDENVAFVPGPDFKLTRVPAGTDIGRMLQEGAIDAIFRPHPPRQVLEGTSDIRRLFADSRAEEQRYYRKNGFYPIMHVLVFRDDVLERHPEAAPGLFRAYREADRISARYYDDPNWSRLAWGRHALEDERRLLGPDIWPNGIARNRANLERFIGYSHDQGLIEAPMSVESLFAESTRDES
jgi:4,5-dihydroxyphthalate decarboxylase